jgi:hypothetical protein
VTTPDQNQIENVRLAIYRSFAGTGRAPDRSELGRITGLDPAGVTESLAALASQRHLVLDASDAIVMAHPFSSINLGFSVMGQRTLWWGGCAWDSFAIPHLVTDQASVLVATTCPNCHAAHAWTVAREHPTEGTQVAHFLTPVARVWNDVVHSCANQRIFCGEACVAEWLEATGHPRGSVFDLATLWRLAEHWYDGRLDSPYRRREPAKAAEYFRQVGLSGSFWGL